MDLKDRIAALDTPGLASIDATSVKMVLDSRCVVLPNPSVDELENYGYDQEFDLDTEFETAVEAFRDSEDYETWAEGYAQVMESVWPVRLFERTHQEVAQLFEDLGLKVAIAEVPMDREGEFDEDVALIVMKSGGMSLHCDIAQGYLACEQVPPTALLDSMGSVSLDQFRNEDMKVLMGVAVRRAADYHRSRMERFEEFADRNFPEEGSAPRM